MRTVVIAPLFILRLEVIHPSTTSFAIAWMEIRIVHCKILSFFVKYLVSRNFGVIDLDIFVLNELNAIESVSQTKDA